MTRGRTQRTLTAVPAGPGEPVVDLLAILRAALSGAGPALLLRGSAVPADPADPPRQLTERDDDPQDPTAAAVTTSGSSGASKTVLLPASALLASAGATHDRLGGAGHWLLALPVQHIAGLQVLVRCLIAGTRPVVQDLSNGFTPEGFVEAAAQLAGPGTGRRYTSLVPTQVSRLLTAPGRTGQLALEALRGFDAVLIGGAATAPALRERAEAAGVRLVGTYGMSETSGGCVYDGIPLDGVRVRIDPDGGRIVLGGPVLARGYLCAPSAESCGDGGPDGSGNSAGFVTDTLGDRWFRTDDAGYLHGERLWITGRLDSVIITGGVNVSPAPVEAALQRLPGVAEAVVVGLPDPDWGERVAAALVLVPGAASPTLAQARALVTEQVSGPAAPRQLTVLAGLPLRGPGKPDRSAIAKLLAEQPPGEGL